MGTGIVLRAVRTVVFASVCVLFTVLGHTAVSGVPVSPWVVAGAVCVTAGGAWRLTGRERRALPVSAAALASQTLLHIGFSLSPAGRWPFPSGTPSFAGGHTGHLPCGPPVTDRCPGHPVRVATEAVGGVAVPGGVAGMLAVHLLVALAGAVWLSGGERAVYRLVRALSAWLYAPLVLFTGRHLPVPCPRCGPVRSLWRPLRRFVLVHAVSSRGPPRPGSVV
jgi:hypothetical protein